MTKLDGYIYGCRISAGLWYVRIGAWTGSGPTVADAMRDALRRAVS